MTALWIIGVIFLVLILIGLIPVGVDAACDGTELKLSARVGLFSFRLRGKKQKTEGDEKQSQKKRDASGEDKKPKRRRKLPPLPVLKILALNGFRTLCRLVRRVRTEFLKIHFVSAFPDPAVTALAYGAAGTAMEGLREAGGGRLRRADLLAEADFDGGAFRLDARLCMTLRVHQILGAGLAFGCRTLWDYLMYKRHKKECA